MYSIEGSLRLRAFESMFAEFILDMLFWDTLIASSFYESSE